MRVPRGGFLPGLAAFAVGLPWDRTGVRSQARGFDFNGLAGSCGNFTFLRELSGENGGEGGMEADLSVRWHRARIVACGVGGFRRGFRQVVDLKRKNQCIFRGTR